LSEVPDEVGIPIPLADRLPDVSVQGAVDAAANGETEGRRQVRYVEPGDLERFRAEDGPAAVTVR